MSADTTKIPSRMTERTEALPKVKSVALLKSPPTTTPRLSLAGPSAKRSFVVIHPRFQQWLAKCGLISPESFLALGGEVVCGHPDRHVARIEIHAGVKARIAFLKREHLVGRRTRWRNWRAGFGWVSRSVREAVTLKRLEDAGLPGPQWIAYGEHNGRAFLLVDELAGATELRAYLDEYRLSEAERKSLAVRIGRTVAELHEAGFATPELAAKHLFLRPDVQVLSLIDWQSAPTPGHVKLEERFRVLGQLHSSLADELASPADRLRVLASYRQAVIRSRGSAAGVPKLSVLKREVLFQANRVRNRSSVAEQRQPLTASVSPRLVWLAGEAVVVTPELAGLWSAPAVREPFYPATPKPTPPGGHRDWVILGDGRKAVLCRFHTVDRFGRLIAALRERPWRSPGATAARILFHLRKHGIASPVLLAFGQRTISQLTAESFVVAELVPGAVPLEQKLLHVSLAERRRLLHECGQLLRKLHDAQCRPNPTRTTNDPLLMAAPQGVVVGSPFAVRLAKRIRQSEKVADLRELTTDFDDVDRLRVLRGYLGTDWADRATRRRWNGQ